MTLPQAFRALGFGPLTARAMLAAALIACIMLLFLPVFSFIADVSLRLQTGWPAILVGAIALNGVAEETLFRGFVFGGLRRAGLSFGRAGTISMAIFAAVHLLLFVQSPFIIAFLSTLLALAAAFPMAYLVECSGLHRVGASVAACHRAHDPSGLTFLNRISCRPWPGGR